MFLWSLADASGCDIPPRMANAQLQNSRFGLRISPRKTQIRKFANSKRVSEGRGVPDFSLTDVSGYGKAELQDSRFELTEQRRPVKAASKTLRSIQPTDLIIQCQPIVDQTDPEQSAGQQINDACNPLAHIEAVETQYASDRKGQQKPRDVVV